MKVSSTYSDEEGTIILCYNDFMNISYSKAATFSSLVLSPLIFIALGAFGYSYIRGQNDKYENLERKVDAQIQLLASTTSSLSQSVQVMGESLSRMDSDNKALAETLATEQQRSETFEQEMGRITGTVGTLDKLRRLDPELLQKYSKVYFLNEHYVPASLSVIDGKYLYSIKNEQKIHTNVLPYLMLLANDAARSSITIYVKSAYRSFYDQANLKTAYTVTYGAGTANRFSAEQGYSEHQLGTTVDFITLGMGGQLLGFEKTTAYAWLLENAHRYGFILSYPKGNGYYIYEPWHWRFVGVALATKLHNEKINFYNADQRVIDEYLISIFD